MSLKIEQDHNRFKQIIKGRIKRELRKYMSKGEMIGKKGKDLVSIPLPQIDLPHFKYGTRKTGGVGQGDEFRCAAQAVSSSPWAIRAPARLFLVALSICTGTIWPIRRSGAVTCTPCR